MLLVPVTIIGEAGNTRGYPGFGKRCSYLSCTKHTLFSSLRTGNSLGFMLGVFFLLFLLFISTRVSYLAGFVMGRLSGPGRAAAHPLKKRWVGPGRGPCSRNWIGRSGPRTMRCWFYMGRSARPMRRPMCFDGPARTAAHEMWCTIATTTTTSTVSMRPPTCFDGPARAVAHEMWCTTATTTSFWVCLGRDLPKTATFVQ